ncbi:MAG: dephospho-CoA kinase [Chloroherpetonaceae bacterium]|nr:dephospho-CoA kinase [Chloroherpetonaceae bacterium]
MIKLGVTGGIGTGKTTVCEILKEFGCFIFSADSIAKEVQEKNPTVILEMKKLFGDAIYQNGVPNRKKIAEVVFADKTQLHRLNAIIHPVVTKAFEDAVYEAFMAGYQVIVKEAAIMFESGSDKGLDAILVVASSLETRLKRLEGRGISKTDALKRIEHQLSQETLLEKSKFVIWNDGTIAELRKKTQEVYNGVIDRLKQ